MQAVAVAGEKPGKCFRDWEKNKKPKLFFLRLSLLPVTPIATTSPDARKQRSQGYTLYEPQTSRVQTVQKGHRADLERQMEQKINPSVHLFLSLSVCVSFCLFPLLLFFPPHFYLPICLILLDSVYPSLVILPCSIQSSIID